MGNRGRPLPPFPRPPHSREGPFSRHSREGPTLVIPAKAGIHRRPWKIEDTWIPAFAGMTGAGVCGNDKVGLRGNDECGAVPANVRQGWPPGELRPGSQGFRGLPVPAPRTSGQGSRRLPVPATPGFPRLLDLGNDRAPSLLGPGNARGLGPSAPVRDEVSGPGGLQNGGVPGMMPPREPVSRSPKFFSQAGSTALTTDSDCGRLPGNLYSTGLCFSDSASLPGVEGGSQGLKSGRRLHMRRTIAQTALVFTSALLLMALVGCGGSSKTTTADNMNGGGGPGGMMPVVPPAPTALTLPDGHLLDAGETTIQPGESEPLVAYSKGRRSVLSCPSGGEACVVTVAADRSATSTGGTPTVMHQTNEMVWQANNGPAGTSETAGAHARGLVAHLASSAANVGAAADVTPSARNMPGLISQSTLAADPSVTLEVTRTASEGVGVELTLGLMDFGTYATPENDLILGMNPGKLGNNANSVFPAADSLGTGWNVATLVKDVPGGQTLHAVVHSDIAASRDSYPRAVLTSSDGLDLSSASDLDEITATSTSTELVFGIEADSLGSEVMVTVPSRDWATAMSQNEIHGTSANPVVIAYKDSRDMDRTRNGHIRCLSSVCQAQEGRLVGTWEIVAAADTGTPDAVYVTLGAWASLPDRSAGEYELGVFARTATGWLYNEAADFTGTGGGDTKYRGPATGLYTKASYNAGNRITSTTVGSFTATTNLTVKFADATSFDGVEGTVDKFMENGSSLGDWSVSLQNTGDPAADGVLTGATVGYTDSGAVSGGWGMQMAQSNSGTNGASVNFGYAAGTFNAQSTRGADDGVGTVTQIVGAFSATPVP